MVLNTNEIINVINQIAELNGVRVTIKEVTRGACVTGICAAGGGLIGGPIGLGIGGTIGSIIAAVQGRGKYKSLPDVINSEMTERQRAQLARSVKSIFEQIDAQDAIMAIALLKGGGLDRLLIAEVGKFMRQEIGYSLV